MANGLRSWHYIATDGRQAICNFHARHNGHTPCHQPNLLHTQILFIYDCMCECAMCLCVCVTCYWEILTICHSISNLLILKSKYPLSFMGPLGKWPKYMHTIIAGCIIYIFLEILFLLYWFYFNLLWKVDFKIRNIMHCTRMSNHL